MKVARSYNMTARAASTAKTAERIMDATKELFVDNVIAEITLAEVAARAGVTVQTVLRRFGDKESLFGSAVAHFADEVHAQRGSVATNDLDDIVANLVEHYEGWGRVMIKMLAEQAASTVIKDTVAAGTDYHRDWCEMAFSDALAELPKADRARRLAQLVAVCDLRTWELLRIRSGLSRHQTQLALHELLNPLITKD